MNDLLTVALIQGIAQIPATLAAILAWQQARKVHTLVNSSQDLWKAMERSLGNREGRMDEREEQEAKGGTPATGDSSLTVTGALKEISERLAALEAKMTKKKGRTS